MPIMNFDLEDGKPPVSFSINTEGAERFIAFMAECQAIRDSAAPLHEAGNAAAVQEPVAYMFVIKNSRLGQRRELAAIDYLPEHGEEIISKQALHFAAPSIAAPTEVERDAALVIEIREALRKSVKGHGSYGPNYDGNKLASLIDAAIATGEKHD